VRNCGKKGKKGKKRGGKREKGGKSSTSADFSLHSNSRGGKKKKRCRSPRTFGPQLLHRPLPEGPAFRVLAGEGRKGGGGKKRRKRKSSGVKVSARKSQCPPRPPSSSFPRPRPVTKGEANKKRCQNLVVSLPGARPFCASALSCTEKKSRRGNHPPPAQPQPAGPVDLGCPEKKGGKKGKKGGEEKAGENNPALRVPSLPSLPVNFPKEKKKRKGGGRKKDGNRCITTRRSDTKKHLFPPFS